MLQVGVLSDQVSTCDSYIVNRDQTRPLKKILFVTCSFGMDSKPLLIWMV